MKFGASWCGPCRDERFKKSYNELKSCCLNFQDIKFVEFDIDEDFEIINDKKYYDIEINNIPSFLIAKNGNIIEKHIGSNCLGDIAESIKKTINEKNQM